MLRTNTVVLIWPFLDNACSVFVLLSDGLHTNRQLADALIKDSADPVDLLRSCMRSGEYQLSPGHVILVRASAERSRRKQRQTSSQSSSQPVVSSNVFMVQSGVCLKRAEPVNTICVMVVFPSLGNELQMRSFLESLDSEHSSSATSVKVKVPAMLIDAISFEESAATLTLTWSKNTRKIQVQGPLTMLDRAKEQLIKLLQTYRTYCESRKVLPPPKGGERAAAMLRCPARSDFLVSRKWVRIKSETCNICTSGSCIRSNRRNRSLELERVSLIGGQSGRVNLPSSWFMSLVQTRRLWKTSM